MSVSIPNSNFPAEEVSSYIEKFTSRIKNDQFSGSSLASKIKYLTDTSGKSLVTVYIDGAKELYSMVNTPDMTDHDKDVNIKNLSMMFNTHILDVLKSLKNLSSELTLYGWKIDQVYPLIRNIFGFGGMNHKTNTPIYGVADFRFVFYLLPDLSTNDGVDGLRITPLCNNTSREGTPMVVNNLDAPEFKIRNRNSRVINEDKVFVIPSSISFDELTKPNEIFAKTVAKDTVNHIIGNGSFASRSLKWKQDKNDNCLTRIMIDYSKSVDIEVRKKLPNTFFHISHDKTKDYASLPSASAQQVVLKITCEESLRFLANWSLIIKELAVKLDIDAPSIGWRATSMYPLIYDKERFVGRHVEKGGSSALIFVPLTPNLVGVWEGKRPLCNNTVQEGFPIIVDTIQSTSDQYSTVVRNTIPQTVTSTYASSVKASHSIGSLSSNTSSIAPLNTPRRVVTGVVGRR